MCKINLLKFEYLLTSHKIAIKIISLFRVSSVYKHKKNENGTPQIIPVVKSVQFADCLITPMPKVKAMAGYH